MPYFAYIVKCKDGTLYTGSTNDLEKRVVAHNSSNDGAKYTRSRRPVRLVYSEKFETKNEAMSKEYKLKQLTRVEKLALITLYRQKKP